MATFNEIQAYFENAPDRSVPLDAATTVNSSRTCAMEHIEILKANPGNKHFMPYWDRLVRLYEACKDQDSAVNDLMKHYDA